MYRQQALTLTTDFSISPATAVDALLTKDLLNTKLHCNFRCLLKWHTLFLPPLASGTR